MECFGRSFTVSTAPAKLLELGRMIKPSLEFRGSLSIWRDYFRRCSQDEYYQLKDGTTLYLSGNPHDVITVMVNLCKREYGSICPGSTVLDIGANIGMYALFAARSGARAVYAYEPNRHAYDVLTKNVVENGFADVITGYNRAVSGHDKVSVYLPTTPSPYNRTLNTVERPEDFAVVETSSLEAILEENELALVDYLKLDCEGAEYEILLESPDHVLKRIKRIRMELHPSKDHSRDSVLERLKESDFSIVSSREMIYWLDRH